MIPFDEEVEWILGRPNYYCGPIANALRAKGHIIKKEAQSEQAAVIYWMLEIYEKHKDNWRRVAYDYIKKDEK